MSYSKKYPSRINWENYPSITTPIDEINLNKMDYALREIDQTLYDMDSTMQGEVQDAEAWAKGTRDGSDVPATDPAYHNNAKYYAEQAEDEAIDSQNSSYDSEAWAKGTRNGTAVPSTDPAYHNNAKYYSEQTDPTAFANMSDVNFTNLQNGQVPKYNSTTQMWENGTGGGAEAIPTYNISIDATPTNNSPIIISGVDFTQPFKLILSTTVSNSTIDLGYIYISDGTTTNLYYAYYKRSDSTGVQSAVSFTKIRYDTSGYVCCLEFLCFKNRQSAYVALCGTDDAVSMSSLSDANISSPENKQVLSYDNGSWKNKSANDIIPIPTYNVTISSAPSSSSPIVLSGVDFTKPFKLIISTASTTISSLSDLYISNGTNSYKFKQIGADVESASGIQSTQTSIRYGNSSYLSCIEFLCYRNTTSNYIAIKQGSGYKVYDHTDFMQVNDSGEISVDDISSGGSRTISVELSTSSMYLLFTDSYHYSTSAYRGHEVDCIVVPSSSASSIIPKGITLGKSTNPGVTLDYTSSNGTPYVNITATSPYSVTYEFYLIH